MEEIKLSINLINSILNYLGNRPYVESAQLIQSIQDAAKAQLPAQEQTEEKTE